MMYRAPISCALYVALFWSNQVTDVVGQVPCADYLGSRCDRLGDPLPNGAIARFGSVRWRYPEGVQHVQFVMNGEQLLVGRADGIIEVSHAVTGKKIGCFGKPYVSPEPYTWCHFASTPDGAIVARATPEGKGLIWNVTTGKKSYSFDFGFNDVVRLGGIAFVNDDKLIGWGTERIALWDLGRGRRLHVLKDLSTCAKIKQYVEIWQVGVSRNGRMLAITLGDRNGGYAIAIWDMVKNKTRAICSIVGASARPVFSPDSRYLAWSERNGTIVLYDARSLKKIYFMNKSPDNTELQDICFSPDGKLLAALTHKRTIRIFDLGTGNKLREIGEQAPNHEA